MKRRNFYRTLLGFLPALAIPARSAIGSTNTTDRQAGHVGTSSGAQTNRARACVLGLGSNGCCAEEILRRRWKLGELNSAYDLRWLTADNSKVTPDETMIATHGAIPTVIRRPLSDLSWMAQDLANVDLLITLGNLHEPVVERNILGIIHEAGRLDKSTVVGVIQPWEVKNGDARQRCSVRHCVSLLRNAAETLVVIQESIALEAMLHISRIPDGAALTSVDFAAINSWEHALHDSLVDVGIGAIGTLRPSVRRLLIRKESACHLQIS